MKENSLTHEEEVNIVLQEIEIDNMIECSIDDEREKKYEKIIQGIDDDFLPNERYAENEKEEINAELEEEK